MKKKYLRKLKSTTNNGVFYFYKYTKKNKKKLSLKKYDYKIQKHVLFIEN